MSTSSQPTREPYVPRCAQRTGKSYKADEALLENEHDLLPLYPEPADFTGYDSIADLAGWKSARCMPRCLSRILLEIVDVRAQRLQEISEVDAQAEGATQRDAGWCMDWSRVGLLSRWATGAAAAGAPTPLAERDIALPSARHALAHAWDKLNGTRNGGRYAWANNPLVWALTFRVLEVK